MANKTLDNIFTEDQMEWVDLLLALDPRAQKITVAAWVRCLEELLPDGDGARSPIEQVLMAALLASQRIFTVRNTPGCAWVEVTPQFAVHTDGGDYRADFQVTFVRLGDHSETLVSTLVECDGHEFHEKTKTQAAHDKRRDRLLTQAGHKVLHFTGSEIWHDPYRCAGEVWTQLQADLDRSAK